MAVELCAAPKIHPDPDIKRNSIGSIAKMVYPTGRTIERNEYYLGGKLKSKCQYVNWRKNGFETCYNIDGEIESKTQYVENKKEGLESHFCGSDVIKIIPYHNDKKEGKEIHYHHNLVMKTIDYRDDKKHGKEMTSGDDGRVTYYVNGKKDGTEIIYGRGEVATKNEWKNNVLHGVCILYHRDVFGGFCYGYRVECTYVDGLEAGPVRKYDSNHHLVETLDIVNGKAHGRRIIYGADPLYEQISEIRYYVDGRLHGENTVFHYREPNPKLIASKTNYNMDVLHGISELYDKTGKVISSILFEHGKAVELLAMEDKKGRELVLEKGEITVFKACVAESKFVFVAIKVPPVAKRVTVHPLYLSELDNPPHVIAGTFPSCSRIEMGTVVKIEDQDGNDYKVAYSFVLKDKGTLGYKILEYKINEEVRAEIFDDSPLRCNTNGIHVHKFPEDCLYWEKYITIDAPKQPKKTVKKPWYMCCC
ncbi:MAG: hypothetical protein Harvfovirus8_14 [Harvfovirus sp.]|uniref:MORN repeat-containing protein n=1 Tax=Harvfovirus sp. TaxID=2487768 RepID=A0A3G5A4W2_9VIRU|nr:MAG: hypothetical protein Harvfovirus8_14 [Harvfovirus sp.]